MKDKYEYSRLVNPRFVTCHIESANNKHREHANVRMSVTGSHQFLRGNKYVIFCFFTILG